jgi:hypothetical protein
MRLTLEQKIRMYEELVIEGKSISQSNLNDNIECDYCQNSKKLL